MTVIKKPAAVTKTDLNEDSIGRALALNFFARRCVVLVPNCNWTGHECDVLAVTKSMKLIDIEIKISRSDFKADASKDKWWNTRHVGYGPTVEHRNHHGTVTHTSRPPVIEKTLKPWPRKVWKHYYCVPADIWSDDLLASIASPKSGVLVLWDRGYGLEIKCVRRAAPNSEAKAVSPEDAIDIARLAGLRMWEAKLRAGAAHSNARYDRDQVKPLRDENQWLRKKLAELCKCSLRTRAVGDGCQYCNPKMAMEMENG